MCEDGEGRCDSLRCAMRRMLVVMSIPAPLVSVEEYPQTVGGVGRQVLHLVGSEREHPRNDEY